MVLLHNHFVPGQGWLALLVASIILIVAVSCQTVTQVGEINQA